MAINTEQGGLGPGCALPARQPGLTGCVEMVEKDKYMVDLNGKRALVTGGSRGIGAAIALVLAENGADIAFTYQHAAEQADAVAKSIEAIGRARSPSRPTALTRMRSRAR